MFDFPLMVSICMLAMAHGSNEINVAAPLSAEIFLLDGQDEQIQREHEFISIAVGIVSVMVGSFLLGQRLLYK
jgi:phosphate/sulfate permease